MKLKSSFLFAIFASFVGCNSQREAREKPEQKGEEVTIELCLFGSWDWKYTYEPSEVDGLKISIINDSISFTVYRFDSPTDSTDEDSDEFTYVEPTESAIVVDDITAKRIKGLADSLFVKKLLPIYDMKREVGTVLEAEDDCLDVECGREKTSIYIGSVYDKGMQHVGDCEVVYSRPFSLFVQLLYDVCAKNSGPKSEELYKVMLHEMKESDDHEILIPYNADDVLTRWNPEPGYDTEAYLYQNIKYPKDALNKEEQGSVLLSFFVEKDGSITDIKVIRGVSPSIDKEAIRVVSNMPKWKKPGLRNGEPVRVRNSMFVNFQRDQGTDQR